MSLPQAIVIDVGGTVSIDLLTRPTTVTIDIATDDGAAIVTTGSGTVSTISTTIDAAAARGAKALSVASATGIVAGGKYWLGDIREAVLVQSVSGTDVTLRRPLLNPHASGAAFQGTQVTYTVSAGDADTKFWSGRAKWTVDGVPKYTALECVTYPLDRHSDVQDLFDRHPRLYEILDPEVDAERLLTAGHDEVLIRLGANGRARAFTAGPEFIAADVLAAISIYYEAQTGDEAQRLYDRFLARLETHLETLAPQIPRDTDQDGVVELEEQATAHKIVLRM